MRYSRSTINNSGNKLITSKDTKEREIYLNIINQWRMDHLFPLNELKTNIIDLFKNINSHKPIINDRLKRLKSIEYKLDINENMKLGRIQDIGGCRIIIDSINDLDHTINTIKHISNKFELIKINDYIANPKTSGYRSIHYIYKYISSNEIYNNLQIELQIRTKLQHCWATTVETISTYTQTSLKNSQGPDNWLQFFKIISALFSYKEKRPITEEFRNKSMKELMKLCYDTTTKMNIISILKGFRYSTKFITKNDLYFEYYLIHIKIKNRSIEITSYKKSNQQKAFDKYTMIEKGIEGLNDQVVLVSASSIKDLREAYPSYFLDTSFFITALETINKNCIVLNLVHSK